MRVCSLSIPAGWRLQSQVRWDFSSANYPVHVRLRVDSPDGKTWVEFFPYEAVFSMQPPDPRLRRGTRAFGALYLPGGLSGMSSLTGTQALQQLLVQPVRNTQPGFRIVSARPISDAQLARAFQRPDLHGEAATMRVQYTVGGSPVEEDFYALFKATTTIPRVVCHFYHK